MACGRLPLLQTLGTAVRDNGLEQGEGMKRFIPTDDDLENLIKAAMFIGSAHRQVALNSEGHMDLVDRIMPWFKLNSRSYGAILKKEVPDWTTHFYGGDNAFMSPAGNDRYEEIPK